MYTFVYKHFKDHSDNALLPTPKMHYGVIFQPAIPKTRQECFYTTLYAYVVYGCVYISSKAAGGIAILRQALMASHAQ